MIDLTLSVRLTFLMNRYLSQDRLPREAADAVQSCLRDLEIGLSDITRLAMYPIPPSYARQLRLAVWAFLAVLPFQMYRSLKWFTIPVQSLAAIIYLGFLEIGVTPSDPFKEGYSGMNIEEIVHQLDEAENDDIEAKWHAEMLDRMGAVRRSVSVLMYARR